MSIEDLEQHGVLLPEEEWGLHELETTASEWPLLVVFLLSAAGCALTYWGGGNRWTWIGIGLFFAAFFLVIILCDRAISRQRERVRKKRQVYTSNGDDGDG